MVKELFVQTQKYMLIKIAKPFILRIARNLSNITPMKLF